MKTTKCLFILLTLFIISSCAGYRVTKFTSDSIKLGTNREFVLKKFGKPFKTESFINNDITTDIIYYKEAVDVSSYTFILTSVLTFENSVLVKFEQIEEHIPDVSNIKTESK